MTLTEQIDAATMNAREAKTDGCRMHWARQVVSAAYQRGDYSSIIQGLDDATRDKLAEIFLRGLK
jgi:hypothetical protein